eukprot:TRINITY_DN105378_c0_g1_i1.p1 TRINITY_DN105378_c0_g1~~TRINITY_DN105378_c0_g1_i1.p1  ORF type:complete len:505 (+),score=62.69 TRINITY_DN105378_c0_g1_i1:25-1539(+)
MMSLCWTRCLCLTNKSRHAPHISAGKILSWHLVRWKHSEVKQKPPPPPPVRQILEKTVLQQQEEHPASIAARQATNIGLFIDGDNVPPAVFEPLLDAVASVGQIKIRRIYLDSVRASRWGEVLQNLRIDPVIVPRSAGGAKDPADVALAFDAGLEAAKANVTAIAIASQDSDFAWVHQQVRLNNKQAFAVLRDVGNIPSNIGNLMRPFVNDILYYKQGSARKPLGYRLVSNFNLLDSEIEQIQGVSDAETDQARERTGILMRFLKEHGYWELACDPQGFNVNLLFAAVAKFFHVNKMGCLTVSPLSLGLEEAYHAVHGKTAPWTRYSNDLVFVEPIMTPERALVRAMGQRMAVTASVGGPFLAKANADLVEVVLRRLWYLEAGEPVSRPVIDLFLESNHKELRARGFQNTPDDDVETLHRLHEIFAARNEVQRWRCNARDLGVRKDLVKAGLLLSEDCSRNDAFNAMGNYMKSSMGCAELPPSYGVRLARVRNSFNQHQPNLRK